MGPVFISYSSRDRDRVAELADALTRHGFTLWWDTHLPPGEDWDERIQRALETAEVVLVVWSEASMASREVRAEATYALQEKKLLPIRVDDVRLWARYNIVQYEDVFSRPPEQDPNWPVVVKHLKRHAGTPGPDGIDEDTAPIRAVPRKARPARGGAVVPAAMILPSAFTGAGALTFLTWLISGSEGPGAQIQLYSSVALLAAGAFASVLTFLRTPKAG
jgi:hypothetical protein